MRYNESERQDFSTRVAMAFRNMNWIYATAGASLPIAAEYLQVHVNNLFSNGSFKAFDHPGDFVRVGVAEALFCVGGLVASYLNAKEKIENKRLTHERDKLDVLFNRTADAVLMFDMDGNILEANQTICDRLGYSSTELEKMNIRDITDPEYIKLVPTRCSEVFRLGHGDYETVNVRKDGTRVNSEVNLNVIDYDGKRVIISVGRDITKRKMLEQEVMASQSMKVMGELAHSVGHDFNNALQVVKFNIEFAKESSTLDEAIKHVSSMESPVESMIARVRQLQRFGGKKLSREEYVMLDLGLIIRDVVAESKFLNKGRYAVEVRCENIPAIYGDEGQLHAAVYNVVKNGFEAMNGGGKLTIDVVQVHDGIEVCITDTGKGIREDIRERLFEKFVTGRKDEGGHGLGLSGAKYTMEDHDGKIYVKDTQLGKGTTFALWFPLPSDNDVMRNIPERIYHGPANILLVDDEEDVLFAVRDMASRLGYTVHPVSGGKEALAAMKSKSYDFIITDSNMPGMSGSELASTIKALYPGTRVAMLTGQYDDRILGAKEDYGIQMIIHKPISQKKLGNLVAELMDGR